jgi:arylsulfatase A-like enzyme
MSKSKGISRRDFLKIVSVIGGGVASTYFLTGCESQIHRKQPNILLIVTDDQRWDTLDMMPTVQKELVDEGMTFTNAYTVTPVCGPSRASLLTGQYVHNHGVLTNLKETQGSVTRFNDTSTLATWLQKAGYRTGLVGKYINGYENENPFIPPGWDDWCGLYRPLKTDVRGKANNNYYNFSVVEANGEVKDYGSRADRYYSTDVLRDRAVEFINSTPSNQPFFLHFSPYAPHFPAQPAERHEGKYAHLAPWRPPNFDKGPLKNNPKLLPEKIAEIDAFRIKQLESLLAVDEAIGSMMAVLEESQQLKDTVILFMSDNGYLWGEHTLEGKGTHYLENLRVPLVIRDGRADQVKRIISLPVLTIDIAPTLAALAGIEPQPKVDGENLLLLLSGSAPEWREDVLVEFWSGKDLTNQYAVIIIEGWKYVGFSNRAGLLYNLNEDPYELVDLSRDERCKQQKAELIERLKAGLGENRFTLFEE